MKTRKELITKATEDPAFREELKADPRGTVEREFGTQLSEGVEVVVLEESRKRIYVVLPSKPSGDSAEGEDLSPQDLDALAGGMGLASFSEDQAYYGLPAC